MRIRKYGRHFGSVLLAGVAGMGATRLSAQTAPPAARPQTRPQPAIAMPSKAAPTQTAQPGTNQLRANQSAANSINASASAVFVAKPYVQLGQPQANRFGRQSLSIAWQTPDEDAAWALEIRPDAAKDWVKMSAPAMRRIAVGGIAPHRVYTCAAALRGLNAGYPFGYRVLKNEQPVFESQTRARMPADVPWRVVAFGDGGADTPAQRRIAYQTYLLKPDMVLLTGNLASEQGRASEYRQKFFPIYNADQADPAVGAPLTRSTLFVGVPGSQDIAHGDFDKAPDGMAYYYYWSQPLNGPIESPAPGKTVTLAGSLPAQKAFLDAAQASYPRMANFSFDYGNAHWTILDSNSYVDWTNPDLRAWVTNDLVNAQATTWRFVAFHHPGFSSAKEGQGDQQMRLLSDIFEQNHVDVVFSGHVSSYQRTYPLTFAARKDAKGALIGVASKDGAVAGEWTLDKTFDGISSTRPKGVLYIVTGAGGAALAGSEQQSKPAAWQPFTAKYIADVHSLTTIDVNGKTLMFRQISAQGKELDHFTVTK